MQVTVQPKAPHYVVAFRRALLQLGGSPPSPVLQCDPSGRSWIATVGEHTVAVKPCTIADSAWVELRDSVGNTGWLFSSTMWVAFNSQPRKEFVVVARTELTSLVQHQVSAQSRTTTHQGEAVAGVVLRRANRPLETCTRVLITDLLSLRSTWRMTSTSELLPTPARGTP